jgi:putative ABC transport system permease protein
MTPISYSLSYWRFYWKRSLLLMLSVAFGLALSTVLWQTQHDVEQHWQKDLAGIDLVVGAKGSGLQLLLATVLHVDIPSGNISYSTFDELKKNPMVKNIVPVSLGDNYATYRIVGTTHDFLGLYHAELAQGQLWQDKMQLVMGATAAQMTDKKIGDVIAGTHGFAAHGEVHEQFPYKIVGILKPTGTVLDRLILTDTESVWYIHSHPDQDDIAADPMAGKHEKEVTAALIQYRSPLVAASLPRAINKETNAQAVSPALAFNQLWQLIGPVNLLLHSVAIALIVLGFAHLATTMAQQTTNRRQEYGVLRALGASQTKLINYFIADALLFGIGTVLMAIFLGQITWLIMPMQIGMFAYNLSSPLCLLETQLIVGAVSVLVTLLIILPIYFSIRKQPAAVLLSHD